MLKESYQKGVCERVAKSCVEKWPGTSSLSLSLSLSFSLPLSLLPPVEVSKAPAVSAMGKPPAQTTTEVGMGDAQLSNQSKHGAMVNAAVRHFLVV